MAENKTGTEEYWDAQGKYQQRSTLSGADAASAADQVRRRNQGSVSAGMRGSYAGADEPRPKYDNTKYPTMAAYRDAVTAWEARQEAKKGGGPTTDDAASALANRGR